MSTEAEPASPLPWKIVEHGPNDHRVVNANAREVIKSYGSCYVYPADAHYIVRAVNAHDELLAACKALLEAEGIAGYSLDQLNRAHSLARAAVAKAKRGEG